MKFYELVLALVSGVGVAAIIYVVFHFSVLWYQIYQDKYVQKTDEDLYRIFVNIPASYVLKSSLICFAFASAMTLLFFGRFDSKIGTWISIMLSCIVGGLASMLPRLVIKQASVLRIRRFEEQLLNGLSTMSNALKAGFSIFQAFESVVQEGRNPIAQEFGLMLQEIRLGVKFAVASESLIQRVPSEDLQIVLTGIETARITGGNLTEVFDRHASVIRERMQMQGKIRSLTAQGRLQGWVVGLLPFALGVALYFMQTKMMSNFLTSRIGMIAVLVMLLLQLTGFLLIRKILAIDV